MATTIKIKSSTVGGKIPDALDLAPSELAINLADRKIYSKDPGGTVFDLVPPASESTSGVALIATQAEVDAGTDDGKTVTALKLHVYADATFIPLASWSAIPALP